MATIDAYFLGVDVGTRSVRSMLISDRGDVVDLATCSIDVFNPRKDFYEQSSDQIWRAVCHTVKKVTKDVDKSLVKGIGFDATCSLVVLDKNLSPLSLDDGTSHDTKEDVKNIIMWMDHRAKSETEFINSTKHNVLKFVGGALSLEMQIPKLLWIANNAPRVWSKVGHFFDLPDFLTFKATGKLSRSLCSLVCKWTYINIGDGNHHWDKSFFAEVGLSSLCEDNFSKIGSTVLAPGDFVGGLSEESAKDLGLEPGTSVATSLIDAHAGGLALVASGAQHESLDGRLGLICGTSTCHMVLSKEPIFTAGVWGPYLSVMIPGLWNSEGGQSAVGSLVDHVIFNHPAVKDFHNDRSGIYGWLEEILQSLIQEEGRGIDDVTFLTKEVHVYPDFHGNRSPLADPSMTGMITGLTLETGKEDLAILYLATLQAVTDFLYAFLMQRNLFCLEPLSWVHQRQNTLEHVL